MKVAAIAVATTISISGALVIAPSLAKAATLDELLAQLAILQAQIVALQGSSTSGTGTGLNLTSDLNPGARGQAVTDLQAALKTNSSLYPEGLVTGYYGSLTTKAVQAFQAKYGIVSSGTPTTTGYGRVGPKTRAKLNEVFGGAAVIPPVVTLPGVTGSGLTIMAGTQPAETLAPENAARVAFTRVKLTASSDGDVTVKSITVKREGLGDDAVFSGVILLDEDGTQIGNDKTFNANHQLSLNKVFTVKAGTSKTMTIAGNMAASLDNYAGQVVRLAVVAVDAGSSAVSGSLPISGNGMTMNSNLAIGTITMQSGANDPGADQTKEVGSKAVVFTGVRLSAGSGEDLLVKSIRFQQSGSVIQTDLKNIKIVAGGTEYEAKTDGEYYWAGFGDGISVVKGGNLEAYIKGDIEGGSNRTVTMDIDARQDIVVLGKLYGYHATPSSTDNDADSTSEDGEFNNAMNPFYNGWDITVNTGTLRVEKSNTVASGNVAVEVSSSNLGAFSFVAQGEDVQITNMVLNFTFSGTGTSSDVTGVQIVDSTGSVVAGPKDPASGIVTLTDSWTVPAGTNVYKIQGKLDSTFVTNDTVTVAVTPSSFTAKGLQTNKSVTPTPSSQVSANAQTVRAAALKVSVSPSPIAQNVVRNFNGYTFAQFQYDGTNSGEDIRVTSQAITFTTSATADADDLNTCQAFDGTTALNTGSNVTHPTGAVGADPTATMNFDNHLIVPKGTAKTVSVKCTISANFVADSTISVGIAAAQDTAATGVATGNSVTESLTAGLGSTMTVKSGGSFTVSLSNSSPTTDRWALANTTDNVMAVFNLHANDEALKLERIHLTFSSSTASTTDFTNVTLWDGATKVGEAVFAGTETLATSTLLSDFIIPKDGDKLLTVKADLAQVGISQPGTQGRRISINYNGTATTSTRTIGQSSGSGFNSGTATDVNGKVLNLTKTYPTLAIQPVPVTTLTNTSMSLYRFSVTAPAAWDVGLYKFTFNVSSSTVSATTSNFYVYGYSDSAFSVQAYGNNPLNAYAAFKVGSTTQIGTQAALGASPAAGVASTTLNEVVIYFDPGTQSAAAPNAEAIAVPAGTTRYFDLKATVSSVGSTKESISVSLLGDAAYFDRVSSSFLDRANTVDAQSTNNDFIWSPNTTTTVTTTNGWTNGFLLPGLPSTNMEARTFSN